MKKFLKFFLSGNNTGFTLIEILVVGTLTLLLSSILITYSRGSENQILLIKEQAKAINFILRAKSLSLQTYNTSENLCGYGVHFNANGTYLIFRDTANSCSASDNKYSGPAEDFEKAEIDKRVHFSQLGFSNILFMPPDPQVLIDNDSSRDSGIIVISSVAGNDSVNVKVNSAGQVSTN